MVRVMMVLIFLLKSLQELKILTTVGGKDNTPLVKGCGVHGTKIFIGHNPRLANANTGGHLKP